MEEEEEEKEERNRINEWPKICDLGSDLLPVIPTSMYTAIKLACSLTCYSFEAPLQLHLVETVKCQTPSGGSFVVGIVHFTVANKVVLSENPWVPKIPGITLFWCFGKIRTPSLSLSFIVLYPSFSN